PASHHHPPAVHVVQRVQHHAQQQPAHDDTTPVDLAHDPLLSKEERPYARAREYGSTQGPSSTSVRLRVYASVRLVVRGPAGRRPFPPARRAPSPRRWARPSRCRPPGG